MAPKKPFEAEVKVLGTLLEALGALDADQQRFVLRTAAERLGIRDVVSSTMRDGSRSGPTDETPPTGTLKDILPKKFLTDKKPTTDVQRIACLAYYLTYGRNQPHFKTADFTKLNTEAAQPRFANTAFTVKNATVKSRFLAPAGKGNKQITALGEAVVNALPDQEAVKNVIQDQKVARRRGTTKKKSTSGAKK